ncbi:type I restriction endonuclease subunit S (plasmid) [Loigolactobacillus backii]|uniref:Type I restriction endonuclease subunit S n=1 Tax=Loigolactobacillus backii TaxID=375175 RepID=A0A192H4K5_9LACO|nr:restriction endonuclease subunit S [Loigolactobacillus backii]ANK63749.1 type I restriction endonuclease subunit S [Loigolactobacillus backii]ANK71112.1 type I restriction endonuclease subunit S [Loigolactobacillus backii]
MKDKQAKYPQLRFKGFTDPWEKRKLSSISERVTRKNKNNESTLPLTISAQDGLVDQNDFFNKQVASRDVTGYFLVKNGEFAYNKSYSNGYPWGAIKRLDKYDMGVLSTLYIVFRPTKINSQFLVSYYDTTRWYREVSKNAAEGARNHGLLNIAPTDFFNTLLVVPKIVDEQQKIGSFFKQLDDIIALHQRKLDLLKEQKKGYLQKMFPKNGAKVPELRFAGFADAWEQRKLGDEVRIVMGQSPNSENYTDDPNDYILVQGNADMKNGRVLPRVWTTQVTKQAEKDDLILSVRAPVGDIGKTAYDVVIGRGVAAIKGNEFIFQNLGKMKSDGYWTRYSTGSTFESINSTDIKEAIISVPAIEEQDKIGSFFKLLDNTIALHQRKLEKLQELKKGYLQKMFC